MILDLVNNLLLYVEPRRKEANQRLQSMRFELQLEQDKDQRGPIISLQNKARYVSESTVKCLLRCIRSRKLIVGWQILLVICYSKRILSSSIRML